MTWPLHLLAVLLALLPLPRPGVVAAAVLHDWDARRAEAWTASDPAALRALYVPGSAAGRADVRMLREWRRRGLRVEGLEVQLLCIVVRRAAPDRLELVVTDRVAHAVAVGPGVRRALSPDRPSTRTIVLRPGPLGWRVEAVTSQAVHADRRNCRAGR